MLMTLVGLTLQDPMHNILNPVSNPIFCLLKFTLVVILSSTTRINHTHCVARMHNTLFLKADACASNSTHTKSAYLLILYQCCSLQQ